ncbi:MAG: HDIG domain-containing protein [Roseiflexaceae bacterium]
MPTKSTIFWGSESMALRRIAQLLAALTAHMSIDEHILVATFLSPGEQRLFERMPLFDRRHCLDVYHTLVRAGHTNPHLLRAALLHDCGKVDNNGRPIPLLYYGIFVVLKALAPHLYQRAAEHGQGWLAPFAVHAVHDQRSARMAEMVGSAPEVVAILEDYGDACSLPATQLLAWADEQN